MCSEEEAAMERRQGGEEEVVVVMKDAAVTPVVLFNHGGVWGGRQCVRRVPGASGGARDGGERGLNKDRLKVSAHKRRGYECD